MEENLDKNNEVNKEISGNNIKPKPDEITKPNLVKDMDMNNGNSQSNSATKVGIKNEIDTPAKPITKLKKDQSYSNQDIKDDWDNADNDW